MTHVYGVLQQLIETRFIYFLFIFYLFFYLFFSYNFIDSSNKDIVLVFFFCDKGFKSEYFIFAK
jgi:hypothetical protein